MNGLAWLLQPERLPPKDERRAFPAAWVILSNHVIRRQVTQQCREARPER